jgi:phage-related baseplate assembly protein
VPGVYRVVLSSPSYTQLTAGQWANCTAITLTQAVSSEHS